MSEEKPLIYKTIIDVMGKISAVGKDRKNQQQNFQYRGIDDVMNELHGVFAECGLFVIPTVLSEERTEKPTKNGGLLFYTRMKIKFTFYAKDGSNVESVVIGEAMDLADKASNKALSIGFKYALLQVFCIPTEEEKDPDGQSHEPTAGMPQNNAPKQPRNPPAPPQKPKPQLKGGDATPEEKKRIQKLFESKYDNGTPVFSRDEKLAYSEKRKTEMTAAELIELIEKELNKRNPPKVETPQQQGATPDKFPEDIPWENGQETQADIF